jgi:hypothetical protein
MSPRRFILASSIIVMTVLTTLGLYGLAGAQDMNGNEEIQALGTVLLGFREVTDPGDPDAIGIASIALNVSQGRVCWALNVSGIAPATVAQIHRGTADVTGPAVVELSAPTTEASVGCVDANPALIQDILLHPDTYYVNVLNEDYPSGAVRGQLG